MEVKQIFSISQITNDAWNQLTGIGYPFLRHEFLFALEQSGSVSEHTGWLPAHLLVMDNNVLIACMPLYSKQHSWGEFVFDQQWAQAYKLQSLNYYPKLVSSIPLTPCQGVRIIIKDGFDTLKIMSLLFEYIRRLSEKHDISSWHCLFPVEQQAIQLASLGLSIREGVQFHWFNRGYRDFNDFLQTMTASKRKMIKRERRRVKEQSIDFLRIRSTEITEAQWNLFFSFYASTYLKRGSQPYLNLDFFLRLAETIPEQVIMVLAIKGGKPIAAALSFIGENTLYGRYWGCHDDYDCLHFETCYYQGLEFCIENGLAEFDSGAQGEHKISRGFEPINTYSAHWLKDERFARAIDQLLRMESENIKQYKQEAIKYLPFKSHQ